MHAGDRLVEPALLESFSIEMHSLFLIYFILLLLFDVTENLYTVHT